MKKYLLSFAVMLMGTTLFTACDDDDNPFIPIPTVVSDGAYVICGGNMGSSIDGSLTYIDYATQSASQNVFKSKNGRSLGMTVNDAIIYGSKMYIVVTNENTIEVVNAKTMESIKQIKTVDMLGAEKGVNPRCVTAADGKIYVSTYGSSTSNYSAGTSSGNGYVAAIDTVTLGLVTTYTAGCYPEGVAIANNSLYVANSDYGMGNNPSISVIDLKTGIDSPLMSDQIVNPMEVAVAGNNIYVLDMGNYSTVLGGLRLIPSMNSSMTRTLFECTHVGFAGHNIYAVNSVYGTNPTEFFSYDITTGEKTTYDVGLDRFFNPNVITADPATGKIYIASYNENPSRPGKAGYAVNGYVAEYSPTGELLNTYDCGVGPNAIVFNAYLK